MTCIKLYRRGLSAEELTKLIEMTAKAAGVSTSEIIVIDTIGDPDDACDDEVIIVPLTPDVAEDAEFENNISRVPVGGRRAICVWPSTGAEFQLPPTAQKFSYSIVPWDEKKLSAAVSNDDVTRFETASGDQLPPVETDRHLCVAAPKKPK